MAKGFLLMTSDSGDRTELDIGVFGEPFGFSANRAMSRLLAQNWWLLALRGICALIFGAIAILWPGITVAALVILFAAYMLADGILAIISAVRAGRRHQRWGLLVVEGILDLIVGAIAIVWPLITIVAFIYLLAAWAIVTGGLMFTAAFRLQLEHGRWLLGLAGLVSVVWGVLLLVWPLAGAVVLALWLGAYALVFGITMLILAFRLRRQHYHVPSGGAVSHA